MGDIIVMVTRPGYEPYAPQLRPIAWAEGVWTVEGPEVAYGPCPTRMTIVRLIGGGLWAHSPISYSSALDAAVAELGPVSALVAPNSHHHLHVETWAAAHPQAREFATPDLVGKLGRGGRHVSDVSAPASWNDDINSRLIDLGGFTEAVFLHRASRTLIVTDLMQNFEIGRVRSVLVKLLLKFGGATGPSGRPSIEIRRAARRDLQALRSGVRQMIAWHPASIILSHGRCFDTEAVIEIERAFAWVDEVRLDREARLVKVR